MRYSSQLDVQLLQHYFPHVETVEVPIILQRGKSEDNIAKHGTDTEKSATKEDTSKMFAEPNRILQKMQAQVQEN